MDIAQTFSESWYRIANQKISLRPGVKVRRQNYRGQRWYVLDNPFQNQFFRLRPAAYEFVARLRPDRTVQEAWQECLNRFPDEAPGQESVIQLLSQLYFANLLQYDLPTDSSQLFERYKRLKQRETRARLLNLMFIRIPLLDPDFLLLRTMPLIRKLISPFGAILWMIVVGIALKIAVENYSELSEQSQSVLSPNNLFLLYIGLIVVKTLHEFGHAYFCRFFGGEVHAMGVMFMIFTPMPYVDATSSWGFRSRWKRILVGAAGMIVEVFVAALAVFIWVRTGPGTLHSLAYNMIFVASVSTVIFNINPLLRYDGYYILSDLIEIPNLHQRSLKHLRHLVERYLFKVKRSESPAQNRREAAWLTSFGILSGVYRVFVFSQILLFVADRLLIIGILMAIICLISWVIVPIVRLVKYLATNPALEKTRPRALAIVSGALALVIVLLGLIPFPNHFRAPGIVESQHWNEIVNQTAGRLEAILAVPGTQVTNGTPLFKFANSELDHQLEGAQASLVEGQARLLHAMKVEPANVKPLESRLEAITKKVQRIEIERENLVVKSPQNGLWVAPQARDFVGRWITRGTSLGLVIDPARFEFTATVEQADVDSLFTRVRPSGEVRLRGRADQTFRARDLRVVPAEHRTLPSAALGWRSGGEIPISANDPQGRQTLEPFFEVRSAIPPDGSPRLFHGQSGKIRFNLAPEPLLKQWFRRLRQLLQKRYQI